MRFVPVRVMVLVTAAWAVSAAEAPAEAVPPGKTEGPAGHRPGRLEWVTERVLDAAWIGVSAVAFHYSFGQVLLVNAYSSDPAARVEKLLKAHEAEWQELWAAEWFGGLHTVPAPGDLK